MSNIPTKGQVAQDAAARAAAAAKQQTATAIKFYTDAIVAEMGKGKNSYTDSIGNVSPEVEKQLRADFGAQGWTLTIRNARTGCTISWS